MTAPLIDAADPPPGYRPPACPIPGNHGTLEHLALAPPFAYVCTPHITAAMQTLGSPSRGTTYCTGCALQEARDNPYGVIRVEPNHSFLAEGAQVVKACRDHLTEALTGLLNQP